MQTRTGAAGKAISNKGSKGPSLGRRAPPAATGRPTTSRPAVGDKTLPQLPASPSGLGSGLADPARTATGQAWEFGYSNAECPAPARGNEASKQRGAPQALRGQPRPMPSAGPNLP